MHNINVVYVTDEKYLKQTFVSIYSVNFNHKSKSSILIFYILYSHLKELDIKSIRTFEQKHNLKIILINAQPYSKYFKNQNSNNFENSYISISTYYRLLMFKILPDEVEKAIYLDSDIIVSTEIEDLYFLLNKNKIFGAVVEMNDFKNPKSHCYLNAISDFSRWEHEKYSYPYFNAGLYIADIKKCKKLNVFKRCLNFLERYPNPPYADQDTLNAVFGQMYRDCFQPLPLRYNVFCDYNFKDYNDGNNYFYGSKEIECSFKNPLIYHFDGKNKPWINREINNFFKIWWFYCKKANIKITRPKFRCYNYIKKRIKDKLKRNSKIGRFLFKIFLICRKISYPTRYTKNFFFNNTITKKTRFFNIILNPFLFLLTKIKYFVFKIHIQLLRPLIFLKSFFYFRFYKIDKPLVSIIVPNYNHGLFLKKRLSSIYRQSYKNYEVILLDDYSSDNSREILINFYNKFKTKTKIFFNKKKSSGVFEQWMKGLNLAKGKFVWIAESDDWCTKFFLTALIYKAVKYDATIAFCNSIAINDKKILWTQNEFCENVYNNYSKIFIQNGLDFFNSGFSWKNIISNASGAIIKLDPLRNILGSTSIKSLHLCGDWIIYANCLRLHNKIVYYPYVINYHRFHNSNTSSKFDYCLQWYEEHQKVIDYFKNIYPTSLTYVINFSFNYLLHAKTFHFMDKRIKKLNFYFNNYNLRLYLKFDFLFLEKKDIKKFVKKVNMIKTPIFVICYFDIILQSKLDYKYGIKFGFINAKTATLFNIIDCFKIKKLKCISDLTAKHLKKMKIDAENCNFK